MKLKNVALKQLHTNIEDVIRRCDITQHSQDETIEVLEILFDHYRSKEVGKFFADNYYAKYFDRLKEIRDISYGSSYPTED